MAFTNTSHIFNILRKNSPDLDAQKASRHENVESTTNVIRVRELRVGVKFADRVVDVTQGSSKCRPATEWIRYASKFGRHLEYRNVVDISILLGHQDSTSSQLIIIYSLVILL